MTCGRTWAIGDGKPHCSLLSIASKRSVPKTLPVTCHVKLCQLVGDFVHSSVRSDRHMLTQSLLTTKLAPNGAQLQLCDATLRRVAGAQRRVCGTKLQDFAGYGR